MENDSSHTTSGTVDYEGSFEIDFDLNLLGQINQLQSSDSYAAPIGYLAVATYGERDLDYEAWPHVFLQGERLWREEMEQDSQIWIVEVRQNPGSLGLTIRQPLAGISTSEYDPVTKRFDFYLRAHDPIAFLQRAGRPTELDSDVLRAELQGQLKKRLDAMLSSHMAIWSTFDPRQTAVLMHIQLRNSLDSWGIQVDVDETTASHTYPARLQDVVMQLRMAEEEALDPLVPLKPAVRGILDISLIEQNRRAIAPGAGLFTLARNLTKLERLTGWLRSSHGAYEAADALEEMYGSASNFSDRSRVLTEQVMMEAFKQPILSVGEWLDTATAIHGMRYDRNGGG